MAPIRIIFSPIALYYLGTLRVRGRGPQCKGNPVNDELPTVLTTADLLSAGWSRQKITRAVARKDLFRVMNGWYVRESNAHPVLSAYARAYPELTFIGTTAAFLYGLVPMQWPGTATHPSITRLDSRIHILRRSPRRTREINNLQVSTPAQTAAAIVHNDDATAIRILERGYAGLKGSGKLSDDLEELSRTERARLEPIRRYSIIGTASGLEAKALRIIRAALHTELDRGDITIDTNMMVRGYCFDLVIKQARVLIEIDSYTWHGTGNVRKDAHARDRCKGNQATRWDWLLLRYTDLSINSAPGYVAQEVADTVRFALRRVRRRRRDSEAIGTDLPMWTWHPTA